jgi:1,4-dihydroxy-6-naphthoate synthase
VEYAHAHPNEVRDYVRAHAQEMDEQVMQAHIDLYVNQHTLDYGADGEAAIFDLIERAERAGIAPKSEAPLFIS